MPYDRYTFFYYTYKFKDVYLIYILYMNDSICSYDKSINKRISEIYNSVIVSKFKY